MKRVVWFISAHGFGHAARSTAIMEALFEQFKDIEFMVVSEIPEWFFEKNLLPIQFFNTKTDVGLIQKNAFFEDIPQTLEHLNSFYFNVQSRFHSWDAQILPFNPDLIVADICPAALDYAHSRNIPSVLTENFTWDWLYDFYSDFKTEFEPIQSYLNKVWPYADAHFQMLPFCGEKLEHSILVEPVSRKPKSKDLSDLFSQLTLSKNKKKVLLTMGGVPMQFDFYDELKKFDEIEFIIPGAHKENHTDKNLRILTHHSNFYHPDLVALCDVVIAKVGYSTLAETFNAGKTLGFVPRYHFRETEPLVSFITKNMSGLEISETDLSSGKWISKLNELIQLPAQERAKTNGADTIASFLLNKFLKT